MMKKKRWPRASVLAAGLMLTAGSAWAQQSSTTPATNTPATNAAATGAANAQNAPAGRLEKYDGDFRASSLVGATVYNEGGDTVGTINDLLVDPSGKMDKAVLSVGGFLGIGSKYVAVTFDQLKIQQTQTPTRANATATDAASGAVTTGTSPGTAPGASTGTAALAPAVPPAGTANPAVTNPPAATPGPGAAAGTPVAGSGSETMYYSVVMPGATRDSIKALPEFKYTS